MKSREDRRKTAQCHICGEIGHVKFDCPRNKDKNGKIKNLDVILRYCKDFRSTNVKIVFENGDKGYIYCDYQHKKRKGTILDGDGEKDSIKNLRDIKFKSVKHFWKNVTKYGNPIQVFFPIYYRTMVYRLAHINLIKYTAVEEDKRSGFNLIKLLEIDGRSVEHNPRRECVGPIENGRYYSRIINLFNKNIMAPIYFRKRILFILWINKNRYWPFIPKDIILIIVNKLWKNRYSFPTHDVKTISLKVLY
jgi:hypothetical protein